MNLISFKYKELSNFEKRIVRNAFINRFGSRKAFYNLLNGNTYDLYMWIFIQKQIDIVINRRESFQK